MKKIQPRIPFLLLIASILTLNSCSSGDDSDSDWRVYLAKDDMFTVSEHHVLRYGYLKSWIVEPNLRSKESISFLVFQKDQLVHKTAFDIESEYNRMMNFWGDEERVEKELLRDDLDLEPFIGPTEVFICVSGCGQRKFLVKREKSYLFDMEWGRIIVYPLEYRDRDHYIAGPSVTTAMPFPHEDICGDFMKLTQKWIEISRDLTQDH